MRIVWNFPHPSRDLERDGSGQTVRARAMRDALRRIGHDVVTVSRTQAGPADRAVVDGYRRGGGRLHPVIRDAGRLGYGWRHAKRVADAVRHHDADVVVETHVAFGTSGAHASARTGVPLVIDDLAPRREEHGFGVGLPRAADVVWRHVTRRARLLVAVNGPIRCLLATDVDDPAKLAIAGNGHDPRGAGAGCASHDVDAAWGVAADAVTITFVGSFLPWHRADLLVDALAAADLARPWHAVLVGDGPRRGAAERSAAAHGLTTRVTFTGRLSAPAVAARLRATDIAVLPGTNAYGNPMKLVEYLAAGTTVVAPGQDTVTELCTHGRTAWLFTPGSATALAGALRAVVHDDRLARRLASAAAASVADQTWDDQARRLVAAMRAAGIGDRRIATGAPRP